MRILDYAGKCMSIIPMTEEERSVMPIRYCLSDTEFGTAVIAYTDKGICALEFADDGDDACPVLSRISKRMGRDDLVRVDGGCGHLDDKVCRLHVFGTDFQHCVWRALLDIPSGSLMSYKSLSCVVGRAVAYRAVGNAVGANPVAVLIKCHRIVRSDGSMGGYRWGVERKRRILRAEGSLVLKLDFGDSLSVIP